METAIQNQEQQELRSFLERELQGSLDPVHVQNLKLQLARLLLEEPSQWQRCHNLLSELIRANDGNREAIEALFELAKRQANAELYQEAFTYLEPLRQIQAAEQKNQQPLVDLYLTSAQEQLHIFKNVELAITLLRRTLDFAKSPEPLRLLAGLLEKQNQYSELVEVYKHLIQISDDESRYHYGVRLFEIYYHHLGQTEAAADLLIRLLSQRPGDERCLLLLQQVFLEQKRWPELTDNLAQLTEVVKDPALINAFLLQRAEICHVKGQEINSAINDLKQLLQNEPENGEALERLAKIYRHEKQWSPLAAVLEKQLAIEIKAGHGDIATVIALEIADLWEGPLNNPERAIDALAASHRLDPKALPVIVPLARLYRGRQRWVELKKIYEAELAVTTETNQLMSLYYRIGELLEGPLNDSAGAEAIYLKAVATDPTHLPINQRLAQLFVKNQQWQSLADLYRNELDFVGTDRHAVTLLHKLASLYDEKLANPEEAIKAYNSILAIELNDIAAIRNLARIYHQVGRYEDLVTMNIREAQLCGDPKQAIALYFNSATICEEHLGKPEMAMMCYQNVLSISPTYVPALRNLGQAYYRTQNWGGLIAMYQREAQVTSEPDKSCNLALRIAEIYEKRLNDIPSAERVLLDLLSKQPNYRPAIQALERLYSKLGRREDLVKIYRSILANPQLSQNLDQDVNLKLAKLLHLEFEKPSESEPHYLSVLEHPLYLNEALSALSEIYSREGRWADLVDVLSFGTTRVNEPIYRFNLLMRIGQLQKERLGKLDAATDTFLHAYQLFPDNFQLFSLLAGLLEAQQAWQRLAYLYIDQAKRQKPEQQLLLLPQAALFLHRSGDSNQALRLYEQALALSTNPATNQKILEAMVELYEHAQNDAALVLVLSRLSTTATTTLQKWLYLNRQVSLLDKKLGQTETALAALEKFSIEHPDHIPALLKLRALYERRRDDTKLTGALSRLTQLLRDRESLIEIRLALAKAWERQNMPAQAAQEYQAALALEREHIPTRRQLAALLKQLQQWPDLLQLLREELGFSEKPALLHFEIGQILDAYQQQRPEAIESFLAAVAADPAHFPSYEALTQIYFTEKMWDDYLAISAAELAQNTQLKRRATLLFERGTILSQQLGRLEEAAGEIAKAFELMPENTQFCAELAKVYEQLSQWSQAFSTYDRLADLLRARGVSTYEERRALAEIAHHQGELALKGQDDTEACIEANERALGLIGNFAPALDRLREIYTRREQWEKLISVYDRSLETLRAEGPEIKIPLLLQMASVYERNLEDDDKALPEYQKVLKLDKDNEEVHTSLARIYGRHGKFHNLAIQELTYLMIRSQPRYELLKEMVRIFEAQGKFDHLYHTYEMMDLMGSLDPIDRDLYQSYAARLPKESTGKISEPAHWALLWHPLERQPLMALYQQIVPELTEMSTVNIDSLGLKKRDRVSNKDENPYRKWVQRLSEAFSLGEVDLYLMQGQPKPIQVFTNPRSVIVDTEKMKNLSRSRQAFWFGYEMSMLVAGRCLATEFGETRLAEFMRSILRVYSPHAETPESEQQAQDFKRIRKLISRSNRKWLEENHPLQGPNLAQTQFGPWLEGIRRSALRAGLLLANKLDDAMAVAGEIYPEEKAKGVWESEVLRELLLFNLSDDSVVLRKTLGSSIYSV